MDVSVGAWIGPAVVAAIISALVTAFGWAVANAQERRRAVDFRAERTRDIRTALRAKIAASLHRLEDVDLDAHLAQMTEQIEREGADFTPFVPHEPPGFVAESLIKELQLLPAEEIGPVILYYRQRQTVAQMADDMRSDQFSKLSAGRKALIYADYIRLSPYAAETARLALKATEPPSSRVSARSDH